MPVGFAATVLLGLVGVGCGGTGGHNDAHGAGHNVASAATVIALDLTTGKQRWQARPPAVLVGEPQVQGTVLRWQGIQSRSTCDVHGVAISMDTRSGKVTGVRDMPGYPQNATVNEQNVTVRDRTTAPGKLKSAKPGAGFPPGGVPVQAPAGSPGWTGLMGSNSAGRMLWADLVRSDDGPALLEPPVHGWGVVAANYHGGNVYSGDPPQQVLMLDARDGRLLWSVDDPSSSNAAAISAGHTYVLTRSSLQARAPRSGRVQWTVNTHADSLAITGHMEVIRTVDGLIEAFDDTGHRVWSSPQRGSAPSHPITIADGLVVFSTPGEYATNCAN